MGNKFIILILVFGVGCASTVVLPEWSVVKVSKIDLANFEKIDSVISSPKNFTLEDRRKLFKFYSVELGPKGNLRVMGKTRRIEFVRYYFTRLGQMDDLGFFDEIRKNRPSGKGPWVLGGFLIGLLAGGAVELQPQNEGTNPGIGGEKNAWIGIAGALVGMLGGTLAWWIHNSDKIERSREDYLEKASTGVLKFNQMLAKRFEVSIDPHNAP